MVWAQLMRSTASMTAVSQTALIVNVRLGKRPRPVSLPQRIRRGRQRESVARRRTAYIDSCGAESPTLQEALRSGEAHAVVPASQPDTPGRAGLVLSRSVTSGSPRGAATLRGRRHERTAEVLKRSEAPGRAGDTPAPVIRLSPAPG